MKNYEKPVVLANNEMSEGVYAASGDVSACWVVDSYVKTTNINEGEKKCEFQIDAHHVNPEQHLANSVATITFNYPVTSVSSNSGMETVIEISGTVVKLARNFGTSNSTENWGFAIVAVSENYAALNIENVYITCE